jgi:hypothetical protein
MAAAILAMTAGVGGIGAHTRVRAAAEGGDFSPLFTRRLDIGIDRLDQPDDRRFTVALQIVNQPDEFIASGSPFSYCLGSLCAGSVCLGSACVGSTCLGSGCSGSTCTGSACLGSTCLGSVCLGSKCAGSACSACGATTEDRHEARS